MLRVIMHVQNPKVHASWEINPKAGIQGTQQTIVNASHMIEKVQRDQGLMGQFAKALPPSGA